MTADIAALKRRPTRRRVLLAGLTGLAVAALGTALPGAAIALTLDEAKARGLIGETPAGYVGAVSPSPSPEVVAVVQDVNGRRRAEFQRLAAQHGTSVEQIGAVFGTKAYERTPSGQYLMDGSGNWYRKP